MSVSRCRWSQVCILVCSGPCTQTCSLNSKLKLEIVIWHSTFTGAPTPSLVVVLVIIALRTRLSRVPPPSRPHEVACCCAAVV